ncbi:gamma-glutamylcyclotransferase family protein [Chitinilyticum piscinae]|uniref:Gamma-glutamylcyclotransferase family protein n=1 Tax=Chitinilyticum piscinae TaxID=2866724 RepID=A0A8J7FKW7_9NEIS|nr:gamma-glutamylcyclotransferase family protein [Chitinilyticum piscinae]MBE9609657.1 gamma-glutamylcyclotransferase [Chitinilyticum piscinae]
MIHPITVLVYGTLKRGGWNHRWLGNATFLGEAETIDWYTLYAESGVPHLVRDEASYPVRGELYLLDYATLLDLDELEGHPLEYRREQVPVRGPSGEELLAWIYFAGQPRGNRLRQGVFIID